MPSDPYGLRAARARAGLTIREVAARVHAGESQISEWERGVNEPSPRSVRKYIAAELLTWDEAATALLGARDAA